MTTTTNFTTAVNAVTFEQIMRCSRIIDDKTGLPFYLVENERGDVDEDGSIIEYKVQYHTDTHKFTCTCKAGENGFAHCHKTGYCKHVVWAVAAAREDKKQVLARRVAEAEDIESTPEFQAEYAEYQAGMADRQADAEYFDSCVPMPA